MLRILWEVAMQHLVIIYKISKVQDQHLLVVSDFKVEEKQCWIRLGEVIGTNVWAIHSEIRNKEYEKWKSLPQRGIGA